jgi:hypothetical protein
MIRDYYRFGRFVVVEPPHGPTPAAHARRSTRAWAKENRSDPEGPARICFTGVERIRAFLEALPDRIQMAQPGYRKRLMSKTRVVQDTHLLLQTI